MFGVTAARKCDCPGRHCMIVSKQLFPPWSSEISSHFLSSVDFTTIGIVWVRLHEGTESVVIRRIHRLVRLPENSYINRRSNWTSTTQSFPTPSVLWEYASLLGRLVLNVVQRSLAPANQRRALGFWLTENRWSWSPWSSVIWTIFGLSLEHLIKIKCIISQSSAKGDHHLIQGFLKMLVVTGLRWRTKWPWI